MNDAQVTCFIAEYTYRPPPDPEPGPHPAGEWMGNIMLVADRAEAGFRSSEALASLYAYREDPKSVTTLRYGQVAAVGKMACVSQEAGMSCWNTTTKHGFFLSRQRYVIW